MDYQTFASLPVDEAWNLYQNATVRGVDALARLSGLEAEKIALLRAHAEAMAAKASELKAATDRLAVLEQEAELPAVRQRLREKKIEELQQRQAELSLANEAVESELAHLLEQ